MEIWREKFKEGDMGRRMVWERMEWLEIWKVGVIVPLRKKKGQEDRGLQKDNIAEYSV